MIPIITVNIMEVAENDCLTRWERCSDTLISGQWGKLTYLNWCIKEAERVRRIYPDACVAMNVETQRERCCVYIPGKTTQPTSSQLDHWARGNPRGPGLTGRLAAGRRLVGLQAAKRR